MLMTVIKALALWIFSLLSRCFWSLEIGGKIYDVGDTANRVSGTELKREAASESMVRAVVHLGPFLQELVLQLLRFGLLIWYITCYYVFT